jgi:hypothetical protein
MNVAMFRQRRKRLRFAWLALVALLLQHVAMVVYACPQTEAPPPQAMMSDCEGTEMQGQTAPLLCDKMLPKSPRQSDCNAVAHDSTVEPHSLRTTP